MQTDTQATSKPLPGGGAERRAHPRKPLRTSATLEAAGRRLPGRTIDVSREGLGLHSDFNVQVGIECSVSFSLPGTGRSHPLVLKGRVVDVVVAGMDGFRIGLLLQSPSVGDRRLLDDFLAEKKVL